MWRQLWSPSRAPITIFNLLALGSTLFSCLYLQMYVLIVVCAIVQVVALVGWIISAFPGGSSAVTAAGGFVGDYMYRSVMPTGG